MGARGNHLKALQRRADHLRDVIEQGKGSEGALVYFDAELRAIDWAIEILDDMIQRESESAEDVVQRRLFNAWRHLAVRALGYLNDFDPDRVRKLVAKGPDGIDGQFARHMEQKLYGRNLPTADDTRPRKYGATR